MPRVLKTGFILLPILALLGTAWLHAQPRVEWEPEQVEQSLVAGEETTIEVTLLVQQDLPPSVLEPTPSLDGVIQSISPNQLPALTAGSEVVIEIVFSADSLGSAGGTIHVRDASRTRGSSLTKMGGPPPGNGNGPPENPGGGNGNGPPDNPGGGNGPPDNPGGGNGPPDNPGGGNGPPDNPGSGKPGKPESPGSGNPGGSTPQPGTPGVPQRGTPRTFAKPLPVSINVSTGWTEVDEDAFSLSYPPSLEEAGLSLVSDRSFEADGITHYLIDIGGAGSQGELFILSIETPSVQSSSSLADWLEKLQGQNNLVSYYGSEFTASGTELLFVNTPIPSDWLQDPTHHPLAEVYGFDPDGPAGFALSRSQDRPSLSSELEQDLGNIIREISRTISVK